MRERLSSLDTSFLHLEGPTTPMHISSLAIYEGPPPRVSEVARGISDRLHLVPRFRQKVAHVPFGGHRPVWVDDPDFDLDCHLSHVRLPDPGSEEQLQALCGRLLSQPLDPTRPLWEIWLVDGLSDGRFALLSKTHHALWDGITGADIHTVLLDTEPEPVPTIGEPWEAAPPPGATDLLAEAAADRVGDLPRLARGARGGLRRPREALRQATELAAGSADFLRKTAAPAPRCPLNVPIGGRRRFELVRARLSELQAPKAAFGTTVNDALLAAVAGALRTWLRTRGIEPRDLRAMVPVSLRPGPGRGEFGNRVAMLIVPLPCGEPDPARRLEIVHDAMGAEKASGQVRAGEVVTRVADLAPPITVAALTRLQSVQRAFNVLVTNVPGPSFPLYLRGRRLLELYPQAPLAANQALGIAAMSYDGGLGFGLLADHDALPDVDVIGKALAESVAEISELGDDQEGAQGSLQQRQEARSGT